MCVYVLSRDVSEYSNIINNNTQSESNRRICSSSIGADIVVLLLCYCSSV